MGGSKVVGLHEDWVNKYKSELSRIRGETPQLCRSTVEKQLHEFATIEVEKALRPLASASIGNKLCAFASCILCSVAVPCGSAIHSSLDKRRFKSKLRKRIGIHGKGSSTAKYDFCDEQNMGGDGISTAVAKDLFEEILDELLGEVVGEILDGTCQIPLGCLFRAAKFKSRDSKRPKFVEAAIERGTLLHCHWISSRLDTLLLCQN